MPPKEVATTRVAQERKMLVSNTPKKTSPMKIATTTPNNSSDLLSEAPSKFLSEPLSYTLPKAPSKIVSEALSEAATSGPKHKLTHDSEEPISNGTKKRKVITKHSTSVPSSSKEDIAQPVKVVPVTRKHKAPKVDTILTQAPTQRLNIYAFGGNSGGELGLGLEGNSGDVAEPCPNLNLAAASVGIVQVATGGMHCAALTHDNLILTWGVNDLGALGRDTTWDGGLVDIKDGDSDSGIESDSGLNPREATPAEVDMSEIPKGTVFTQLAAGDNITFALTNKGLVYGWGTIRGNDGVLGFSPNQEIQKCPTLMPVLKRVTKIAVGSNHALALTSKGSVFVWGSGEQNQLGRRMLDRTKLHGLVPRELGLLKNIINIGAGSDHSFAIHKNGNVYSWGLNCYGQTGIVVNAGGNEVVTPVPTIVKSLKNHGRISCISGGNHHSIAVTEDGGCLVWGRVDGYAAGLKLDSLPAELTIKDLKNRPKILTVPTRIPGLDAAFVTAGSDHCIAITKDAKAFSWGFNANCQTGQKTADDVECATLIDHPSITGKKLVWAGAGGQYSMLAGEDMLTAEY